MPPRIQTLFEKKEPLQRAEAEVEEALSFNKVGITDPQVVRCSADDLRKLSRGASSSHLWRGLIRMTQKLKCIILFLCPHPARRRRRWEFRLSYTTVKGEGEEIGKRG